MDTDEIGTTKPGDVIYLNHGRVNRIERHVPVGPDELSKASLTRVDALRVQTFGEDIVHGSGPNRTMPIAELTDPNLRWAFELTDVDSDAVRTRFPNARIVNHGATAPTT